MVKDLGIMTVLQTYTSRYIVADSAAASVLHRSSASLLHR
jgi:hypothetical protein